MRYDLYTDHASDPKLNAQRNLDGRTHYVDNGTLGWHKARVLSCHVSHAGQLLTIIESVALDQDNTKRGFRYVTFDLFGTVISRVKLENCWPTQEKARERRNGFLAGVDAVAVNREGLARERRSVGEQLDRLAALLGGEG